MTGGMRNSQLAMMGSESALRGGEVDLWTAAARSSYANGGLALPPCGHSGVQPCVYQRTNGVTDLRAVKFRASKQWIGTSNDGAQAYSGTVSGLSGGEATASLASQPRYLIEDLGLDTGASGLGNMGGSNLSDARRRGHSEDTPVPRHRAQPGRHVHAASRERKRVWRGFHLATQSGRHTMTIAGSTRAQFMSAHQTKRRMSFAGGTLLASLLALFSTYASATTQPGDVDLSPTPPDLTASVDPNIVVTFDDSGSMASNFMGDFRPFDTGSWSGPWFCAGSIDQRATDPNDIKVHSMNGTYYNPLPPGSPVGLITYPPPVKEDNTLFPNADSALNAVWADGIAINRPTNPQTAASATLLNNPQGPSSTLANDNRVGKLNDILTSGSARGSGASCPSGTTTCQCSGSGNNRVCNWTFDRRWQCGNGTSPMDGVTANPDGGTYPNGGPYYYRLKSTVAIPVDTFGNPTAAGRTALYTASNWEAIPVPANRVPELRQLVRLLSHAQPDDALRSLARVRPVRRQHPCGVAEHQQRQLQSAQHHHHHEPQRHQRGRTELPQDVLRLDFFGRRERQHAEPRFDDPRRQFLHAREHQQSARSVLGTRARHAARPRARVPAEFPHAGDGRLLARRQSIAAKRVLRRAKSAGQSPRRHDFQSWRCDFARILGRPGLANRQLLAAIPAARTVTRRWPTLRSSTGRRDLRTDLSDNVPPYVPDKTTMITGSIPLQTGDDPLQNREIYFNPVNDPASWQHVVQFMVTLGISGRLQFSNDADCTNPQNDLCKLREGQTTSAGITGWPIRRTTIPRRSTTLGMQRSTAAVRTSVPPIRTRWCST